MNTSSTHIHSHRKHKRKRNDHSREADGSSPTVENDCQSRYEKNEASAPKSHRRYTRDANEKPSSKSISSKLSSHVSKHEHHKNRSHHRIHNKKESGSRHNSNENTSRIHRDHVKEEPSSIYIKQEPESKSNSLTPPPILITEGRWADSSEPSSHKNERKTDRYSIESRVKKEKINMSFKQAIKSENDRIKSEKEKKKEKPSLEPSGKLNEEQNVYKGVVIKYSEPPEARIPKTRWRFYPFKGDEALPVLHLHRQSAFLIGRQRAIVDMNVDHPSCSKQHAVLQYRLIPYTRADGQKGQRVRPYIIDLGSQNGTYLNNNRIESQKYYELMEKDVIKFGYSTREYVMLHEKTDTSELNDEGVDNDDIGTDDR